MDLTRIIKGWSPYMKPGWKPLPLQLAFCVLPNRDILYGGSAGGAKSEALLAAALQYTHVPNYAAVIYRKTYQDLVRPGALLDRAHEWLSPYLGREVKFDSAQKIYTFVKSGAKLAFGHMGRKGAQDTMQGSEYHFVGIDEVTQHNEADVLYALSRLRRKASEDIPLRFRLTANPGGIGHQFVYRYFQMEKNPNHDSANPHSPMYIGTHPTRLFIPSRLADNPYIDQNSYIQQLKDLDPTTRARLLEGDWSASPFGRFKPEWFQNRYKVVNGVYLSKFGSARLTQFQKFATIDVAASFTEGVGGKQFVTSSRDATDLSSGDPCWTVCAVWGVFKNKLFLLDVHRAQTEIPEVFHIMAQTRNKWGDFPFLVEKNGVGTGVAQGANRLGFHVEEIWTTRDKVVNSYDAANMAAQRNIVIPGKRVLDPEDEGYDPKNPNKEVPILGHEWLDDWESEIFTWMGLRDETSDQVDTLSTAAKHAAHLCLSRLASPTDGCLSIPKVHGMSKYGNQNVPADVYLG